MEASSMYNIRTLNIWRNSETRDIFRCKEVVLESDASNRKESDLSMKMEMIFDEILQLVPTVNIVEIKEQRGGKLRFPIYLNEKLNETELDVLDLSVRSSNCLHRAGFRTVGDLVNQINGSDDLKRIRNCGAKSVDEIMEKLFCYQYSQMGQEKKLKYINRILELNSEN